MANNISPLGDRVIVEIPESGESKSKKGIIIKDSARRGESLFGKVAMVGPGIYSQLGNLIPMTVKVGDSVMYKKDMGGDPIKINDKDYLLFREQDLLMVDSQ